MKKLFLVLILLSGTAQAGPFVEVFTGVHPTGTDAPEIGLKTSVSGWAVGYNHQVNQNLSVEGGWQHWSGTFQIEKGLGFNPIYLKARYEW